MVVTGKEFAKRTFWPSAKSWGLTIRRFVRASPLVGQAIILNGQGRIEGDEGQDSKQKQ